MRALLFLIFATIAQAQHVPFNTYHADCPCLGNGANWTEDSRLRGFWDFNSSDLIQTLLICQNQIDRDKSPEHNDLERVSCGTAPNHKSDIVIEGCRSFHLESDVSLLWCRNSLWPCTESELFFHGQDFTAGCWEYPTAAAFEQYYISTDNSDGSLGSGYHIGMDNGSPHKKLFDVDPTVPANEVELVSTNTYALSEWHHHVARFTNSSLLMEQVIDGGLDALTATASAAISASDRFTIGQPSASRTPVGRVDECFAFQGVMSTNDICYIGVCGWKGCDCVCDGADYVSHPKHSSEGGPMNCTLPACNKAGPD